VIANLAVLHPRLCFGFALAERKTETQITGKRHATAG